MAGNRGEASLPREVRLSGAGREPALSESERLKERLERLRRANSRLREMERLRVDLTHMVIHDLKGPLAEIIANLNLLEEEGLSPVQRDYLGSAILGAEELLRRVQNILETYRLETKKKLIHPTPFDPVRAVRKVVKGLGRLASMREISILVESSGGSHPLFADRDFFTRIVLNLLSNAIEHTPAGKEIRVDLCWIQDGKRLQVSVTDAGPGIGKRDRKRIFQKFFTTGRSGLSGHLGLGLPFCKLAVEAHRGKIWVEDLDGAGSRFVFSIPNTPWERPEKRRRGTSNGSGR
ncbi:MAG: HAMP domain-containing histidine kinase [Deltaproteobacteria bacterium]|nr:HAMP domain-containing histidine kinase [Deltaproteobacteria bacterium]